MTVVAVAKWPFSCGRGSWWYWVRAVWSVQVGRQEAGGCFPH